MEKRIDGYDHYYVNEKGEVWSYPFDITYTNRWGTKTTYTKKKQKLKYDWKIDLSTRHKLARVQLYDLEGGRKCYYVGRLVYTAMNGLHYDSVTTVRYRDGDTSNLHIDNLYSKLDQG